MKEKVCIIVAYFGKFPNYFSLWLKSCEMNPNVNFLLVTDAEVGNRPANVTVYKTDLKDVKEKASCILGFEVALERPYKMCDYKPAYGLIFSDLLSGYDYWGHCDVDLIFGDLQSCFEKYNLSEYDRFLPLGHLSLYKNDDEVNNRFKSEQLSPNYKEVFTNDKNFTFDEMGGMTTFYANGEYPFFNKRVFADIASIYHRYRVIEEYIYDECPRNYPNQIFTWENGKCYREWILGGQLHKEEYVYVHFKKRPNFNVDFDIETVNSFYITNIGFVEKTGETTLDIIKTLNPYPGKLYEDFEFIKAKISLYLNAIKSKIKR